MNLNCNERSTVKTVSVLTAAVSAVALLLPVEAAQAPSFFRLAPAVKHEKLVRGIPTTDSELLERVRADPRLLVFTKDEVPPVFQAADNNRAFGQRLGVFRAGTTFTVGGVTVGGGSNQFPWRTPAGLGDATNWDSFQFLWLPEGQPILYGLQRLPNDLGPTRSVTWTFPVGTVLGEVLGVLEPGDPEPVPFEMRVRRKVAEGEWRVDVFRPYRNREELNLAVALLGSGRSEKFLVSVDREEQAINQNLFKMIPRRVTKDFLPPLDPSDVRRLLDTTFVSVRGEEWSPGAMAPDTRQPFHLVPRSYNGAMLNPTNGTCRACHRTAGQNIRSFGMPAPANWDEWARGNGADESMTWHPFHPDSVSSSGTFLPVFVRGSLVDAGLLKQRKDQ